MSRTRRCIATFVAACIGFGGLTPTAQAGGLISAEQVAASVGQGAADDPRARLLASLERADVASELVGTVALVFVLLIFTDILGYTRIFPFIKSNR